MKPFNTGLMREVKPISTMVGFTAVLHILATLAFVVQAVEIARVISQVFLEKASLQSQMNALIIGFAAWICRALLNSLADWVSRKSGLNTVGDLRKKALSRISQLSPQSIPLPQGALLALLTRGIDGIEIYVAKYLPQLILSVVIPAILTSVIGWLDITSALIVLVTIPLIPVFMMLVGWFTQSSVQRHWQEMNRVAATLSDLLDGLPELKIFGRSQGLAKEIRILGEQQKTATMRVLSLSFLSAFVLELLATISVALIAVGIGVRLVNGDMELWRGLAALIMAPEVYAPLRQLGVHFHAAAEGLEAWDQLANLIDKPIAKRGDIVPLAPITCEWSELIVQVGQQTLKIPPGKAKPGLVTVIHGPSGCGKSTLLSVLLGNQLTVGGNVTFTSDRRNFSPQEITERALSHTYGYVGQDAWLGEGTIRDFLGEDSTRILNSLGIDLPLDTEISDRNQGVSVGQRRRIAVARELSRQPFVLLLDEPAAALDDASESALVAALQKYAAAGHTVIAVAHRRLMISAADVVINFSEVPHAA